MEFGKEAFELLNLFWNEVWKCVSYFTDSLSFEIKTSSVNINKQSHKSNVTRLGPRPPLILTL